MKVLNTQLEGKDFIGGEYSIADIACWPGVALRVAGHRHESISGNVKRWYVSVAARPAAEGLSSAGRTAGTDTDAEVAVAVQNLTKKSAGLRAGLFI